MGSGAPTALTDFLGGFVAAEGTFSASQVRTGGGIPRPTFAFAVALGATDREMCELMRAYLGVGRIRTYARRAAHYDDECVFAVRGFADLVDVVVPFMDEHLPPSHKRTQYLAWREQLLAYDDRRRAQKGARPTGRRRER